MCLEGRSEVFRGTSDMEDSDNQLTICSYLSMSLFRYEVGRIFGEYERYERIARGAAKSNCCFLNKGFLKNQADLRFFS